VKVVAIALGGAMAALTGALVRTCQMTSLPPEFANAWCGDRMPVSATAMAGHCAGCLVMVAGLLAMLFAGGLMIARKRRPPARATPRVTS